MAQEATPAPARHVPPRVQEMRASFSSSCLLGEAGGEGSVRALLHVPGPPCGPPDARALHHPLLSCHPLAVGPQGPLPARGPQAGARHPARGHLPPPFLGHSRQRSGPLQFCGCPPSWAHWREYSAKVAQGQEGQRHRSWVQAAMYTSASTSPWQEAKAGPSRVRRQTPSWETGRSEAVSSLRACAGIPALQPLQGQGAPFPEVPFSQPATCHPSLSILSSFPPPTSPSTALSVHPGLHPVGQLPTYPPILLNPDSLPCLGWSQLGDPRPWTPHSRRAAGHTCPGRVQAPPCREGVAEGPPAPLAAPAGSATNC